MFCVCIFCFMLLWFLFILFLQTFVCLVIQFVVAFMFNKVLFCCDMLFYVDDIRVVDRCIRWQMKTSGSWWWHRVFLQAVHMFPAVARHPHLLNQKFRKFFLSSLVLVLCLGASSAMAVLVHCEEVHPICRKYHCSSLQWFLRPLETIC